MARMQGVEPREAGLSTRLVYWFVKRALYKVTGKADVPEPIKIIAHQPKLLRAVGQMESGQAAAASVPAGLKALAGIRAATLVGCPF
jgi:4-carboxymuconolactone decarboxylase